MKPHLHSKNSVTRFGGKVEDYQAIHDFIDHSKAHFADMRHRALLHSSFGIYLCEQVFGITFRNSSNKEVSVRDVAERHVIEDLGRIPTVHDYLSNMTLQPWMGGLRKKIRKLTKREFIHVD